MRPRAIVLLSILVALVVALALLARPDPTGGPSAGAGSGGGSGAVDGGGGATWWRRVLRRVGLGSGGDEPPPWVRLVEGVVVDERGDPVADAEVTRHSPATDHRSPGRVRSGPDGVFRIHVKDGDTDELEARAPGRRSRRAAADGVPLRLQLLAESGLEVVVREAGTREPVRGAEVEVRDAESSGEGSLLTWKGLGGRVAVDLAPATSYVVRVRAAGFAPALARVRTVPGRTHRVDVDLGRGAVLLGTLRDHAGGAVAGAEVELQARHDALDSWDFRRRTHPTKATTDAAGRFEFRHVPTGTASLSLAARTAGGASTTMGVAALVEGEERRVEVRFPEPTRVSGRVVRVDGTPVVEGTVRLHLHSGHDEPETQIDETGAFAFDAAAAGDAMSLTAKDAAGRWREVEVSPRRGGHQRVTVVIPEIGEGPAVRKVDVRVLDAKGTPVRRAVVRAERGSATTDASGVAPVSVGESRSVVLWVRPPAGLAQAKTVDVSKPGVVEFRLGDGVVAGRVRRHDGTPSRSVLVLGLVHKRTLGEELLVRAGFDRDGRGTESTVADPGGSFRFTGVGEGKHVLSYRESDDHPWSSKTVTAGETGLDLRLPSPSGLLRSFEVEVLDEDGRPAATAGVGVVLESRGAPVWQDLLLPTEGGVHRSDGDAESASLVSGSYDVVITPGPGHPSVKLPDQRIGEGVHRWTVRRGPVRRLEGVVRGPDGRGVEGVTLLAGPEGWQERGERLDRLASTDVDGRYVIEDVVPGRVELSLRSSEWGWTTALVEIGSGRVTTRDFVFAIGGTLEVWPSDGRLPLDGTHVALRRLGSSTTFERAQVAGDDARDPWVEFRNVLPGRVLVTVAVGDREVFRREVAVEAGGTTVVVVPP